METKNHAELAQIKQWVDSLNCNQTTPDEKKAMLNRLSAREQCEGPLTLCAQLILFGDKLRVLTFQ